MTPSGGRVLGGGAHGGGVLSGPPLLLAGMGAAVISTSAVLIVLSGASAVSTAFYRSAIALPVLAGRGGAVAASMAATQRGDYQTAGWRSRQGRAASI
jgi:hypothetical protein